MGRHLFQFTVPGEPMGKPRMTRRDKWAKRDCVMRYRSWADLARDTVSRAGGIPDGAIILDVSWVAYFAVKKSWSKKRQSEMVGTLHRSKPDRDNIDKALLDSVFAEDKHIAVGTLRKEWSTVSRLEVTITYELEESGV